MRFGQDDVLDVLALSGGGSHGAFGAGVLKGWSESGTRPSFDVVTGISTGALTAPFAFLGAAHDGELERLYTTSGDDAIFESRGLAGLFGDGLRDTAPLRRRVTEAITPAMLDEIAAEHRKGRRLYVGPTDLDSGEAEVWDLGDIAQGADPARRRRFTDVLVASASVPGLFNPVYLDDGRGGAARMHVDGGVKAPLLLRDFMVDGRYRSKAAYFIVNGCICLRNATEPVAPSTLAISRKSIEELMRSSLYRALAGAMGMARKAGARPALSFAPDAVKLPSPLSFDPAEMRALFEVGRAQGRNWRRWPAEPPRMQRFG